jgi:hypothetical protein
MYYSENSIYSKTVYIFFKCEVLKDRYLLCGTLQEISTNRAHGIEHRSHTVRTELFR